MDICENEHMLGLIVGLLKHIENVQKDVMEMTEKSAVSFHDMMIKNNLAPDKESLDALQFQDIITQQLNAIGETVRAIEKSITVHIHAIKGDKATLEKSIKKLSTSLEESVNKAKEQREAFKGNSMGKKQEDVIEFF